MQIFFQSVTQRTRTEYTLSPTKMYLRRNLGNEPNLTQLFDTGNTKEREHRFPIVFIVV